MVPRRLLGLLALSAPLLCATAARADSDPIARAEELLRQASLTSSAPERFRLAGEARTLALDAAKRDPRSPEPHLLLARALGVTDPADPARCRPGACEEAVTELRRARALDQSGADAARIAQELGLQLSRLRRYDEALGEYDRSLHLIEADRLPNVWDDPGSRSVYYGNSAETLMALGRLDQAIGRYRRARDLADAGTLEWELAEWGLGVALDRDEQIDKGAESIRKALEVDPTMSHLADDNVFFEPPGDVFYYRALGHEVAGDRELAIAAFEQYLATTPTARWARRARAHLDELRRTRGRSPDPSRLSVRFGPPETFADLRSAAALRQTLARYQDDARLCYARALRTSPRLGGELTLGLEIGPGGWVFAKVIDDRMGPAAQPLERCLERAAASWRFAPVSTLQSETVRLQVELGPP